MTTAALSETSLTPRPKQRDGLLGDAFFCAAVLALAWCFWLYRIGVNDYNDSVSNEVIFAREPLSTILFAMKWQDQSPLYFVVLHFWKVFGDSPGAIRAINLLGMSGIALSVYRLALSACGSRNVARVTLALAAASPFGLWVVREGRMYTFQILFSVLAATWLVEFLETRSRRSLALFVFACALNIYDHFFGFLISGLFFGVMLLDSIVEPGSNLRLTRTPRAALLRLRDPLLAGVALGVLALPQLVRLHTLVTGAPEHASWSMPGLSRAFASQLHWLWFRPVRAGLGVFKPISDVQIAAFYALFALGIAAAAPRLRRLALIWTLVPALGLGLLAFVLDLRDRYFAFVTPIIWVVAANGAVGALPAAARARWLATARRGLLVFVVLVSVALLTRGLEGRYAEWTKVMTGLDRLYRPSMSIYMPPGPSMGIPPAVVAHRGLHEALGVVHPLSERSKRRFRVDLAKGRDFVFLLHRDLTNDALRERSKQLRDLGYEQTRLGAWNARADVFSRTPIRQFATAYSFAGPPSDAEIAAWVEARLEGEPGRAVGVGGLGGALVVRFDGEGGAVESTFFTSQNGESGEWRVSGAPRDGVAEHRRKIKGRERSVIVAPVTSGERLAIALPNAPTHSRLSLAYGLVEGGEAAEVGLRVFAGGRRIASNRVGRTPEWSALTLETGGRSPLILLVEGLAPGRARLAFGLD